MDITVYLPDALGARAKQENINLSRMLRDAITEEFAMRDAMKTQDVQVYEVKLEEHVGRITGNKIAEDDRVQVFLTDDERVLAYDASKLQCHTCSCPMRG